MHKIDLDEKMFTFHVVGSKKWKKIFNLCMLQPFIFFCNFETEYTILMVTGIILIIVLFEKG